MNSNMHSTQIIEIHDSDYSRSRSSSPPNLFQNMYQKKPKKPSLQKNMFNPNTTNSLSVNGKFQYYMGLHKNAIGLPNSDKMQMGQMKSVESKRSLEFLNQKEPKKSNGNLECADIMDELSKFPLLKQLCTGKGQDTHNQTHHQKKIEQKSKKYDVVEKDMKQIINKYSLEAEKLRQKKHTQTTKKVKMVLNVEKYRQNMNQTEDQRLKMLESQEIKLQDVSKEELIDIKILQSRSKIDQLLKYLLSFDYFSSDDQELQYQQRQCGNVFKSMRVKLPQQFVSMKQYQELFEPLLFDEITSKIKGSTKRLCQPPNNIVFPVQEAKLYSLKFVSNQINHTFENNAISSMNLLSMVQISAPSAVAKCDEKHYMIDLYNYKNSLLVISTSCQVTTSVFYDKDFQNQKEFLFLAFLPDAKIGHHYFHQDSEEQFYKDGKEGPYVQALVYINKDRLMVRHKILEDLPFSAFIYPLEKIISYIREYLSLNNIQFESIQKLICNPLLKLKDLFDADSIKALFNKFFKSNEAQFNQNQCNAIKKVCMSQQGFSILQGPPGTGKTYTLIGIISGIYHYIHNWSSCYKKTILICAPSNAGLDEIIHRIIKFGIRSEGGNKVHPKIVRVGLLQQYDDNKQLEMEIHRVSIDYLVQSRMKQEQNGSTNAVSNNKAEQIDKNKQVEEVLTPKDIKLQMDQIKKSIQQSFANIETDPQKQQDLKGMQKKLHEKFMELKQLKMNYRQKYDIIQQTILRDADIVCATLNSSGSDKLECLKNNVEAVIIDEACQCYEVSSLIPLMSGVEKVILIGDQKQLPATIFSLNANRTLFNRSLFERIVDGGVSPIFLNEQYRMDRQIKQFSNETFYHNRINDAASIDNRIVPEYCKRSVPQVMYFIDIPFSSEQQKDFSYFNIGEIQAAFYICQNILKVVNELYKKDGLKSQCEIGFISPYQEQVKQFQAIIAKKIGPGFLKFIKISTIDSFQGQEKDIIIFSTVRSSDIRYSEENSNLIGFLKDKRRMNVALTRARYGMFLLGNATTLCTNATWAMLIQMMIKNGKYLRIDQLKQMAECIQKMMGDKWNEIQQMQRLPEQNILDLIKEVTQKEQQQRQHHIQNQTQSNHHLNGQHQDTQPKQQKCIQKQNNSKNMHDIKDRKIEKCIEKRKIIEKRQQKQSQEGTLIKMNEPEFNSNILQSIIYSNQSGKEQSEDRIQKQQAMIMSNKGGGLTSLISDIKINKIDHLTNQKNSLDIAAKKGQKKQIVSVFSIANSFVSPDI